MMVSSETVGFVEDYINVWLILGVSACGVVFNSIHLCVYGRMQNYHASVVVPILAISLWNLLRCLSACIHRLCGPIGLISEQYGAIWRHVFGPYLEDFVTISGNVSLSLVAYLSVTRCLYVVMPTTAMWMLSSRVTLAMVVSISVAVFAGGSVTFFPQLIKQECRLEHNLTNPHCEYSDISLPHGELINKTHLTLCLIIPLLTLCVLCTSSVVTVHFLKLSADASFTRDRRKVNSRSALSRREKEVAKVLLVFSLFIVCYALPQIIFYSAQLVVPEFHLYRNYSNIYVLTLRILTAFDLTNSAAMFVICLKIRPEFRVFFRCFP